MLTIDEAIVLERQAAKYQIDRLCTFEHEQIAKWLEELKDYQDKNKMVVRLDVENVDSIKDKIEELSKYAESQYNKAIDDFIHECDRHCGFYNGYNKNLTREDILMIAEQLKAGVENEQSI